MSNFTGKRIVLTGASRGVGYEASKLFLAAGAEVIGTGRDAARLEKTTRELQAIGKFTPFLADFDTLENSPPFWQISILWVRQKI